MLLVKVFLFSLSLLENKIFSQFISTEYFCSKSDKTLLLQDQDLKLTQTSETQIKSLPRRFSSFSHTDFFVGKRPLYLHPSQRAAQGDLLVCRQTGAPSKCHRCHSSTQSAPSLSLASNQNEESPQSQDWEGKHIAGKPTPLFQQSYISFSSHKCLSRHLKAYPRNWAPAGPTSTSRLTSPSPSTIGGG